MDRRELLSAFLLAPLAALPLRQRPRDIVRASEVPPLPPQESGGQPPRPSRAGKHTRWVVTRWQMNFDMGIDRYDAGCLEYRAPLPLVTLDLGATLVGGEITWGDKHGYDLPRELWLRNPIARLGQNQRLVPTC